MQGQPEKDREEPRLWMRKAEGKKEVPGLAVGEEKHWSVEGLTGCDFSGAGDC